MKLGPITKSYKIKKQCQRKLDDDIMSVNCDVIVVFSIYGQSGATGSRIPDAQIVKLTFSLIVTFYPTKTANRIKRSLTQLSHYCFQ